MPAIIRNVLEQRVLSAIAFDALEQTDQTGETNVAVSVPDLAEILPFVSTGQIITAVKSLKQKGLLKSLKGFAVPAVALTPKGWDKFK